VRCTEDISAVAFLGNSTLLIKQKTKQAVSNANINTMKLLKVILSPVLISLFLFMFFAGCSNKHHEATPIKSEGQVINDVTYENTKDWKGNDEALKMDIYMPVNARAGKRYPLVLFMHGGGFLIGDKESAHNKCSILADSGFVAVSINYRLGWDKGNETCKGNVEELEEAGYRAIQDANTTLRFLVLNAAKYSIDTSWIFAGGSSAGAIAALCMTYLNDSNIKNYYPTAAAKLGSLKSVGSEASNTFSIKAICSISGALPDSALINKQTALPAIYFHGENDETIPADAGHYASCNSYPQIYGSECLYRALARLNIPVVAHIMPRTGHDDDNDFTDEFKMSNTAYFFHKIMNKEIPQSGLYFGVINNRP